MRLRRSDPASPGISRVRRGKGFSYLDQNGHRVSDAATLARITALVIPPAWTDVWITPWPHGHIQAVGTDAAGRRQYRYHDEWRRQRDAAKHDHVLELAARLPGARRRTAAAMRGSELTRDRVMAGCFRLLDAGSIRVGGETYAQTNETFGLATLRRDHVAVVGRAIELEYVGKAGKAQCATLRDPSLARLVGDLLARDEDDAELFGWWQSEEWHDVKSSDVNDYLRELFDADVTAKDFRTWNATVLMAQRLALADAPGLSRTRRQRLVAASYRDVADYLGNTPTVAKASYVDPRVVDLFHDGVVVPQSVLPGRDAHLPVHPRVERAVARMLLPKTATRARAA
jgi:DNA topoisomerase IB